MIYCILIIAQTTSWIYFLALYGASPLAIVIAVSTSA